MSDNPTREPKLVCVCGKRFETVETLHQHKAYCREFQAKQDKEAMGAMVQWRKELQAQQDKEAKIQ